MKPDTPSVPNREAIEWVLANVTEDALGPLERATLTEAPSRERWFELLPELDYEIKGGTQDDPRWGFEEHPWFAALGVTKDECEDYLQDGTWEQ